MCDMFICDFQCNINNIPWKYAAFRWIIVRIFAKKTFKTFIEDIKKMWTVTKDNHSTVGAYKDADGITHKLIIKELQSLASEKLIHHLGSQGLNWTSSTPLKDYYDQFTVLCPAIADMYDFFFASVPLTISFLE